jgi:hypothetical protein
VEKTENCWIWKGWAFKKGYGGIKLNGKSLKAHRLSYYLHKGPISKPLIMHSCDNRLCVNPSHLFEGTNADNMNDMKVKGRARNINMNKARCKRGHIINDDAYVTATGARNCRVCLAKRARDMRLINKIFSASDQLFTSSFIPTKL